MVDNYPMDTMDLNQVRVFVQVVEAGSFTAAGTRLGMPKSTVSARVSQLEEHLGVRLLQRTTRSLGLTDAGAAFFDRCARIVADLDEAERSITDLAAAPRGTLRVTAPIEFSMSILGDLVAGFGERFPEVSIEVVVSDRVVDLVDEGIDLAIRAGRLKESSLIARRLARITTHLWASPGYLERHGTPKSPRQLERHACLLFSSLPEPDQWSLHDRRGKEVAVRVRGVLSVNSLHTVRDAAARGMGIALLPLFLTSGEDSAGLTRVLPAWSGAESALHAVYPSSRYLSPKVRAFVDYLGAAMSRPPWDAVA
jgi:DNA-binding transcriptional LysR family regulator